MALPRKDNENILVDIAKLKEQMESTIRHDKKFTDAIDNFDLAIKDINISLVVINGTLSQFKDIPSKVRILEDKSITQSLMERGLWFVLGIVISVFIQNQFIATKENQDYSIQKTKE